MATKISEYSSTPASNTDLDGINLSENVMVPSDVNDALRMQMAHLKDMDTGTSALTSPELTSATISGGTIDNTVVGGTTAATGSFTNVTVSGTVDGRDVSVDGAKLDGIEASADVTDATNVAAAGALMTAGGTMTGDINFGTNDKATFGSGDLEVYHSGTHSFIDDSGTGNLYIRSSDIRLQKYTGENMIIATADAGVTLYYDNNAPKLATTATGVDVTGTVTATGLTVDGNKIGISNAAPASVRASDTIINMQDSFVLAGDININLCHNVFHNGTNWVRSTTGSIGLLQVVNNQLQFFNSTSDTAGTTVSLTKRMNINGSGDISFFANNGVTQGFYWDSSTQRLGLGTTTPSHELTVSAANDSGVRIDAEGNNVSLMLTDETTSNGFRLNYNAPNDVLSFDTTNGTGAKVSERMRILAGGGITFNGDTAAANALDDYEEGTWTATIGDDSGNTSNTSTGYYTKIGNLVRVHLNVITNISTAGLVAGDAIQISGLPYNPTNGNHAGSCYLSRTDFNGKTQLIPYAKNGTDQIRFQTTADNVNNANILVSNVLSGVADLSALVIVYHTT